MICEEENEECPCCNGMTVRHDRVQGNVKCFTCGYVVKSHFQTYEQEVNNYENDPDQMNKMRGLVQEGKDFQISIGKEIIDDQPGKRKKKIDQGNQKKAIKALARWCDQLEFNKRESFEIEQYYNILLNMDQTNNINTSRNAHNPQREIGFNTLKRWGVIAIYIFIRVMKLSKEEEYNLKQICTLTGSSLEDIKKELENIKGSKFEGSEKICNILFEKRDYKHLAEKYAKQAGLSDNDKRGYLALCFQIKEQQISMGEQTRTKLAAALYAVFKLSTSPDLSNLGLKNVSKISEMQESTIKKFFDGTLYGNLKVILEEMKYQQYNWKHYSEIKKE